MHMGESHTQETRSGHCQQQQTLRSTSKGSGWGQIIFIKKFALNSPLNMSPSESPEPLKIGLPMDTLPPNSDRDGPSKKTGTPEADELFHAWETVQGVGTPHGLHHVTENNSQSVCVGRDTPKNGMMSHHMTHRDSKHQACLRHACSNPGHQPLVKLVASNTPSLMEDPVQSDLQSDSPASASSNVTPQESSCVA
jgi:hypothetical protein